ncbi:transposon mariner sub-class [Hordeum vulgare]|nr:transposon mariner sub-class [Hordeum vulgare]
MQQYSSSSTREAVKMENMVVPDLNFTPPIDEMDEDPLVEMDEDATLQMDEDAGVWNIQRVWKKSMRQIARGFEVDVSSQRKGNHGRKAKDINLDQIPTIPLNKRSTIRSLAWQLGCSLTTLHKKFMLKLIKRHSNCVKPVLKENNKKDIMKFFLSMLDETSIEIGRPKFKTMHNIVHIDEKWFYMTKKNINYYLLDKEEEPTRTIQSCSSIGKIMFLTVVARPRCESEGNVTFSEKNGIWPFVKEISAQRRRDNRPRGTIETKSIKVNMQVMREFMINNLLPAIQSAWPENDVGETIFIQQDNTKPHILPNDREFLASVESTGLDITLIQQPANSPDLNGLDLGFFSSLQSLTNFLSPRTLQGLIKGVLEEFQNYEVYKMNRVFLSLQACMIENLNHARGNGYKIPHVNK